MASDTVVVAIGWIFTILLSPSLPISFYILLNTIQNRKQIKDKPMKIFTFYCVFAFVFSILLLFISMVIFAVEAYKLDSGIGLYLNIFGSFLWYHGKCALNMVFVCRLHYVFRESSFKVRMTYIYILLAIVAIDFVALSLIPFIWLFRLINIGQSLYFLTLVIDTIFPIVLTIIFNRKLAVIMNLHSTGNDAVISKSNASQQKKTRTLTLVKSKSASDVDNSDSDGRRGSTFALKFRMMIVRYTVLTSIAGLSSVIAIIAIVIIFWGNNGYHALSFFAFECIATFDSFINVVCLFFYFGFGAHLYMKTCGLFHDFCGNMYGKHDRNNDEDKAVVITSRSGTAPSNILIVEATKTNLQMT